MRILLSAYSCAPHRGSEPGIGWNTAIELARTHEVWVVTAGTHRAAIEQELALRPRDRLHVVYHDLPFPLRWTSREGRLVQVHYYLWQYSVYPLARRLGRDVGFDVVSHVTFGRYWSPSLFALLPAPFVWGSAGGGETVPPSLRACLAPKDRLAQHLKAIVFALYRVDPLVRLTARRSSLILAGTPQTARRLAALSSCRIESMDTAVVDRETVALIDGLDEPAPRRDGEPVCYATMTRLVSWKGVHLGLQAFGRLADPRARYVVVGDGPQRRGLEELARRLGIAGRVDFRGHPTRAEWMRLMKQCHALVHPALASPFNTIVLEAMLCARPVVYLRRDDIEDRLGADTGYPVEGPDPDAAVAGLARAMRCVAERPAEARERGRRGRERALRHFTWDARIDRLERLLEEAAGTRDESLLVSRRSV
jgi:glycosyltransferase involved in cell wall biosynthesis